jgi:plastocyanin
MRFRPWMVIPLFLFASPLLAMDRFVAIAGSVNNFRTDMRLFNPSFEKTIEVNASFMLPGNVANNAQLNTPVKVTLAPREMKVFDDVVASLLGATGLGGIHLTSADEFLATTRIYAQTPAGTLGQFITAPIQGVLNKGVLLHLKSNSSFRTNIGGMNAANRVANITWKLYDKSNAVVATRQEAMQPFAVITPQNIAAYFTVPAGTDLSDAWVGFSSTPDDHLVMYASVIDNSTTDQYFVPAQTDSGTPPAQQPTVKVFDVTLEDFSITFSPAPNGINVGDTVRLRIRKQEGAHGFALSTPNFQSVINESSLPGNSVVEKTFTVTLPGAYTYFCTNGGCGAGHSVMNGEFMVGNEAPGGGRPGY